MAARQLCRRRQRACARGDKAADQRQSVEEKALKKCKVVSESGRVLFSDGRDMTGFFERMRGMDGMREVSPAFAMVFRRCGRIQCKAMKVPIDVVHLDADGRVLAACTVYPGQMGPKVKGCKTCVEMAEGRAAELKIEAGSALRFVYED